VKSILPPQMKGVMMISGYPGKGKSILAATADFPQNIAFFDLEDKSVILRDKEGDEVKLGYYKAISQEKNDPLSQADLFLQEIGQLEPNRFTVAVIDNVTPLEVGLQIMVYRDVEKYAKMYRCTKASILDNQYAKALTIMNDVIVNAICKPLYAKGVRLIIITSHVKDKFRELGKKTIQGRPKWQELSILTLILIDGDFHPVPSAMVRKENLGVVTVQDSSTLTDEQLKAIQNGEIAFHQPTRSIPNRLPRCDWQSIRHYIAHPANLIDPAPGEALIELELDPFSDQLSNEQITYQLRLLEKEHEEQAMFDQLQNQELVTEQTKLREFAIQFSELPIPLQLSKLRQAIENGEIEYSGELTPGLLASWS
jgi:hypothetical protein